MKEFDTPTPTAINLPSPDGVEIEQTTTRGNGTIELGEIFERDDIDFSHVVDHLAIHTGGQVAGSQFNGEVFASAEALVDMIRSALPETLQYDQHGRAELTLMIEGAVTGYSGVKSLQELGTLPTVQVEKAMRMPGGEPAEVDGVHGAWYPEMVRNPGSGRFEVVLNADGSIKNPHGKFEPDAWIAKVDKSTVSEALATNKVTMIVQDNPDDGLPVVLTIFPGENAPAFPAKVESETYHADTLQSSPEAAYWSQHAFIQAA